MYLFLAKIEKTALVKLLDKNFQKISETKRKNGDLLKMIDVILKKKQKSLKNIKTIFAVNDSGTFSGVRSVIAISNALSFALKIPTKAISIKDIDDKKKLQNLLKKKKSDLIMPKYNKEPNIT